MNQSMFRNDAHAQGFTQLLARDKTHPDDNERRALFYCLSAMDGTLRSAGTLYDFKNRVFNCTLLGKLPHSRAELALIHLGYNLFSGRAEYPRGRGFARLDCDVMTLIESMDKELVNVVINAVRIRRGMA